MCPSKKLIQETKAIIRLDRFLRHEVRLKEELSAKELKHIVNLLKKT